MTDLVPPEFDEKTVRQDLAALAELAGPAPYLLHRAARRATARRRQRHAALGVGVLGMAAAAGAIVPGILGGSDRPSASVAAASSASSAAPSRAGSLSVPPFTSANPWLYTLENWNLAPFSNPCHSTTLVVISSTPPGPTGPPTEPEPILRDLATAGGGQVVAPSRAGEFFMAEFMVDGRAVHLSTRELFAPDFLRPGTETTVLPSGSVLELDRSDQKVRVHRVDGTVWDVSYFTVPIDNTPEAVIQDTVQLMTTLDAAIPAVAKPVPENIDPATLCPIAGAPTGGPGGQH